MARTGLATKSSGTGTQQVAILHATPGVDSAKISWAELGTVVNDVAALYQLVKERQIELLLVADGRTEITASISARVRRQHGLTEIWKRTAEELVGVDDPVYDGFFDEQLDQEQLSDKIAQILQDKELLAKYGMVARSVSMKSVARTIRRVAPTDIAVMIVGPSGSGKELVARALHRDSSRSDKPFVAINCGALAEGVLESELFGHEKGAFTGSVAKREGLFFKAEGGTIFLDEIGELKPDMQVKLLRVLEDGAYYPVGSSVARKANVRVVAATNRDLTEAIADGEFREDLYYRIGVVKVVLPPLMARRGDILPLLQFFWRENPKLDYSDSAIERLTRYDWPGNVRQLRNFSSRMIALKPTGLIDIEDVEKFLSEQHSSAKHLPVSTGKTVEEAGQELIYRAILSLGNEVRMLRDLITAHIPNESTTVAAGSPPMSMETSSTMEEMEKVLIENALKSTGGNRKEAARKLGIGERTLYRKLNKFDLS